MSGDPFWQGSPDWFSKLIADMKRHTLLIIAQLSFCLCTHAQAPASAQAPAPASASAQAQTPDPASARAQAPTHPPLTFQSSDTALQGAFYRAKAMALHYQGAPNDPVGPWYESALPPRNAFCMRDVSHQSIAAEVLGLSRANENMFTRFAQNISSSKDWCTYWEMNREGRPAPEDYRNDTAFWYNLNANFDLLYACWKLYLWTGNRLYIEGPVFASFHRLTVTDFIRSWVLQPDSLLTRPAHPNAPASFDINDNFYRCRGLPSYSEGVPNIKMGVDLVAAIFRGLLTYASILEVRGHPQEAVQYAQLAAAYQQRIDADWWDDQAALYHTYYSNDGHFGKTEGETFLLWFDALKDSTRRSKTIEHLLAGNWNMENLSYFPYQLYRLGYPDQAYRYMLHLTDPSTPRREYPEVSYGVLGAFVQGLMGIEPDARARLVATLYRGSSPHDGSPQGSSPLGSSPNGSGSPNGSTPNSKGLDKTMVALQHIPLLGTYISVTHRSGTSTIFTNEGVDRLIWRARFAGKHASIVAGGKRVVAQEDKDAAGHTISFADIVVPPHATITASIR
jgi:hypothetical protein